MTALLQRDVAEPTILHRAIPTKLGHPELMSSWQAMITALIETLRTVNTTVTQTEWNDLADFVTSEKNFAQSLSNVITAQLPFGNALHDIHQTTHQGTTHNEDDGTPFLFCDFASHSGPCWWSRRLEQVVKVQLSASSLPALKLRNHLRNEEVLRLLEAMSHFDAGKSHRNQLRCVLGVKH